MNILETKEVEDSIDLCYFDVQNLVIDHSFSREEIEECKDLIFSPNSLRQIYFKGTCDYKTIELIKNLLTISEYIQDSKVEKYVLIELSPLDKYIFLNSSFKNPSSWNIPYSKIDDTFELTDVPRYRTLQAFIDKLDDKNLSCCEQIMKVYDEVKQFEYDEESKETQLPEIISSKKSDSYGFNLLFTYILKSLGYKASLGRVESEGVISYVSLVDVVDPIYNINGLYVFDPSMDSLPKEKYDSKELRRINYNYFMNPLSLLQRNKYNDNYYGSLAFFAIDDLNYSNEKKDNCKNVKILKEVKDIEDSFGLDFSKLHERFRNTKTVSVNDLIKMNDNIYHSKISDLIRENYLTRKDELFEKDSEEELEKYIEEQKK